MLRDTLTTMVLSILSEDTKPSRTLRFALMAIVTFSLGRGLGPFTGQSLVAGDVALQHAQPRSILDLPRRFAQSKFKKLLARFRGLGLEFGAGQGTQIFRLGLFHLRPPPRA